MTPQQFIAKWKGGGGERQNSQPFFEDLCRLIGHPTPREADPGHEWFTYEYGAAKTSGGKGWADVWKRGYFGWEFKGTDRDLNAAYRQLKNYADALQNPPLLIVCDMARIIIHTNFTNAVKRSYEFTVEELESLEKRQLLEAAFNDPERLKPGTTRAIVTKDAADKFSALAQALRGRGDDPHAVAHFLNRLLFCMFAEDIGLLPRELFTKLVEKSRHDPELFEKRARELFAAMHKGGDFALENIAWFNGGLFDDDATLRLTSADLELLLTACRLDWSEIEPSIFGTLFERGLNPDKRSQLGAHYTDPETIMKIIRPVILEPWLAEWRTEKAELAALMDKAAMNAPTKSVASAELGARTKAQNAATKRLIGFLERLRAFTVLDPACGSGNFLFLALRELKSLEKRVLIEAEGLGLPRQFPEIGPRSVKGIELNDYAAELARVTIWIGEIQWMLQNGFGVKKDPILDSLQQIECRDALLNADDSEAIWPAADVVIGNPPFVGDKKMLGELGEPYVTTLRKVYEGRVPGGADLVCYWFEKANDRIRAKALARAGLVTTNSIRGGRNREVLKHICETARIFNAWSDEEWVNEGAAVRVSLVCFGNTTASAELDSATVDCIFPDLTAAASGVGVDLTHAKKLVENRAVCFYTTVKAGPFDISGDLARAWLPLPNPNGRPNSDVVRPWVNAMDVTRRPGDKWVIDYGVDTTEADASMYELPFAYVSRHVRPVRQQTRREKYRDYWWLFAEPISGVRKALKPLKRFVCTPAVAKHRVFVWLSTAIIPDHAVMAIARDDDTAFGVLHSQMHEIWSLRMCTYLGVGNDPRYTPTTCFETFPFPEGLTPNIPAKDYAADPRAVKIAEAASKLVEARDRWLNPPEWIDRVPEVVEGFPERFVAKPGFEAQLKKRTLTNLYNERPPWLANLHGELDRAVAAAYGWEWPLADDEILPAWRTGQGRGCCLWLGMAARRRRNPASIVRAESGSRQGRLIDAA